MPTPRGWYSRGYLPHIDAGCVPQFLTWRLDDAIPDHLLKQWRSELVLESEPQRKRKLWRLIESYMDAGHGSCVLRKPNIAKLVQDALFFHNGQQYDLHDWVVMPNHVHTLLTPKEGVSLETILHSQKSFTGTEINKVLGEEGRIWQPEYFDRIIRDARHFEGTSHYIRRNPVKAKLCSDAKHWPYSSASYQFRER